MDTVWTLTITHRHGTDTTVHRTQEGALHTLARYCADYWNEVSYALVPENEEDRIAQYFEAMEEECYDIDETILQD